MYARNATKQGGFAEIIIVIVVLVLAGFAGAYYLGRGTSQPQTSPSPVASPSPKLEQGTNTKEEVLAVAKQKLAGQKIEIQSVTEMENSNGNVYTVSFANVDGKGNVIPAGGSYILVGKVGNKWVAASHYDKNYCEWVGIYVTDEATRAFMGYTDNCK